MKTILPAILLVASFATHAQSAKPPACDELKGMEREACLKQGGTIKANSAASGATAPKKDKAKKDYPRHDSK